MARQTASGYRSAGPLMNGISGGGAEGIDLLPQARRVLHAQQVLLGIRAPGPLTSTPPVGSLPPAASYILEFIFITFLIDKNIGSFLFISK
jgi:hypothetical protein